MYTHILTYLYILTYIHTYVNIYPCGYNLFIHTSPPDLLLMMMIAVTIRTSEMVTTVILAEAIATGTTMLFASIGIWVHVAGI